MHGGNFSLFARAATSMEFCAFRTRDGTTCTSGTTASILWTQSYGDFTHAPNAWWVLCIETIVPQTRISCFIGVSREKVLPGSCLFFNNICLCMVLFIRYLRCISTTVIKRKVIFGEFIECVLYSSSNFFYQSQLEIKSRCYRCEG